LNHRGKITTERWSKATSNVIIGVSQTVKDGKTVAFEFLRIVDNGHGAIYVAKPSNAKDETGFLAKKISANEVIFENSKHDFPQRIIYRLQNKKSLSARIEGKQGDKEVGIDFPMTRIKCG
jgi:ribosomal protein S5